MKKLSAIFLVLVLVMGLSACGNEVSIIFPFSASDVETVESYYDDGGSEIQKKTTTDEAAIDYLYTYFSELPLKNKQSSDEGNTLKFVFTLADGTTYELTYIGVAVKTGRLKSQTAGFDYFTSSDVVGVWNGLSGEIELTPKE